MPIRELTNASISEDGMQWPGTTTLQCQRIKLNAVRTAIANANAAKNIAWLKAALSYDAIKEIGSNLKATRYCKAKRCTRDKLD